MQDLQILLAAAASQTIGTRPGSKRAGVLHSLEFLSNVEMPLRCDAAYLMSESELPELSGASAAEAAVCFVQCDRGDMPELPAGAPDGCTFVFVRGSLLQIYSTLNAAMDTIHFRHRADDIFLMAESARYTPEQLADAISQLFQISAYILNASYQRICGVSVRFDSNPYAEELSRAGALTKESVRRIRSGAVPNAVLYESEDGKWSRFNLLLLWRDTQKFDSDYLCRRLAEYILAFRRSSAPPDIPPFLIDQRLNRILEGVATDEAEIKAFFGVSSTPVWYAIVTLGSDPGVKWSAEAYQKQARLLLTAFRNVTLTVIRSQIAAVLILPASQTQDMVYGRGFFDEHAYANGWDEARLEHELQLCGVYLCRSAIFASPRYIATEYGLITDALDIAIRLDGCLGRRIANYFNYSPYITIKYAMERFLQDHDPRSIRAMLYPEMVTLLLHDIRHKTDLLEVLYRYYIYGDVNLTAQSLFVHRNTVYNKLKAIQKLLNVDLDDYTVRSSYINSLQIFYYCEKCLGLDLRSP